MHIDVTEQANATIVRLTGDLTGEEDASLSEAVTSHLSKQGSRIILDLAGVKFMNSTGLGELVKLAAQANVQSCRLLLARPSPFIAGMLQATQLDKFFAVTQSVESALAAP